MLRADEKKQRNNENNEVDKEKIMTSNTSK